MTQDPEKGASRSGVPLTLPPGRHPVWAVVRACVVAMLWLWAAGWGRAASPSRPPTEDYGICVGRDGQMRGVNEERAYAMHSVVKFPQALWVAECIERTGADLGTAVLIKKKDLEPDTWSPMLELFGEDERTFTYAELLALSLQQSDNNACDLLFRLFGRPRRVERYIRSLGIMGIRVRKTERQVNRRQAAGDENCCTPRAMVELLEWFYQHRDDSEALRCVWRLMADCRTGTDRLPAAVPAGAVSVHKTGTGYRRGDVYSGLNDVGIVVLPDGQHCSVAVFVTDVGSEGRIADIARAWLDK